MRMKELLGEAFKWVSTKFKIISITSGIVASLGLASYTKVTVDSIEALSKNCEHFESNSFVTGTSAKGRNCGDRTTPTKEKETLQGLHQLTELDLEKLFPAGEYSINQKEALELKNREDSIFRSLSQHRQVVYIQGSADKAGDSTFIKSLANEKCGNQEDFNRIQLHASSGANYEKQLSYRKIPSPFTNADLPQLRARSFQCWLKSEYPNISVEILEGGVQSTVGSQYRRVRIFIDDKSITNKLTSIPSPD
jgi:hypothetical protein